MRRFFRFLTNMLPGKPEPWSLDEKIRVTHAMFSLNLLLMAGVAIALHNVKSNLSSIETAPCSLARSTDQRTSRIAYELAQTISGLREDISGIQDRLEESDRRQVYMRSVDTVEANRYEETRDSLKRLEDKLSRLKHSVAKLGNRVSGVENKETHFFLFDKIIVSPTVPATPACWSDDYKHLGYYDGSTFINVSSVASSPSYPSDPPVTTATACAGAVYPIMAAGFLPPGMCCAFAGLYP